MKEANIKEFERCVENTAIRIDELVGSLTRLKHAMDDLQTQIPAKEESLRWYVPGANYPFVENKWMVIRTDDFQDIIGRFREGEFVDSFGTPVPKESITKWIYLDNPSRHAGERA